MLNDYAFPVYYQDAYLSPYDRRRQQQLRQQRASEMTMKQAEYERAQRMRAEEQMRQQRASEMAMKQAEYERAQRMREEEQMRQQRAREMAMKQAEYERAQRMREEEIKMERIRRAQLAEKRRRQQESEIRRQRVLEEKERRRAIEERERLRHEAMRHSQQSQQIDAVKHRQPPRSTVVRGSDGQLYRVLLDDSEGKKSSGYTQSEKISRSARRAGRARRSSSQGTAQRNNTTRNGAEKPEAITTSKSREILERENSMTHLKQKEKEASSVLVEDASDDENDDLNSVWRNRRPAEGEWIEPVEDYQ